MTDRRNRTSSQTASRWRAAALAVLVGLGASLVVDRLTEGSGHPLAWTDLTAELGPVAFPRQTGRVYRRRAKLEAYLRAVMPGRAPTAPGIDFSRGEAVLVATGPRSSTGYDLRVVRLRETADRVVVLVYERTPSLGEPVTARVTYPYRLITFRKSDKPVHVDWQGRP